MLIEFSTKRRGYYNNVGEVIEKIGYDKNADIDYTPTSIFCSKGQGFLVSW